MLGLTSEAMESAWERVRDNEGCAGVDGVTVEAYERQAAAGLPELLCQAERGTYRALPLRMVVVEKRPGSSERRRLLVPAVRDRILETAVARALSHSFEEEFLEASFAYRPNYGVDRAVARIVQLRDRGWGHVVDADIESYFDSVSQSILLGMLERREEMDAECLGVIKQWLKAPVWDGRAVQPRRRGIAQGAPISPLLSNYYLGSVDQALSETGNRLIRYGDDFLILCQSAEAAGSALRVAGEALGKLALRLKMEKTRLTSFEEGFRFLGVVFRGTEAMIPWRARGGRGRVVFMAHPMPARVLKECRQTERPKEPIRPPARPAGALERMPKEAPDMAYLYVTQQGAVVRKSGDRFLVEQDGQIILDIPYHRLDHILVFGNVQLTSQSMAEALDHNISLSLFTRTGRYRGSLSPPAGRDMDLRLAQYRAHEDAGRRMALARATVRGKLENSRNVLKRYEDRGGGGEKAGEARKSIERILEGIDGASCAEELNGHEGAAAAAYFEALMKHNRSEFPWEGRKKHPATDPLNALLSLAYTMIMQELTALAEGAGLDPAIGFLHELDGSRPSLALDMMEVFRGPIADRLVMTLVNRRQVTGPDFEPHDRGALFLKAAAMRRFFEEYEKFMLTTVVRESGKGVTYRDALRREVENFGRCLRTGEEWKPFVFPVEGGETAASA